MRKGAPHEVVLVTVKRVSGKETYEEVYPKKADSKIHNQNKSHYWKNHGFRWKFRYRINVYFKSWKDPEGES